MTDTVRTLAPYMNSAPAPGFLSGMFAVTDMSYMNSEKVRWDVQRDDEDVAFPLPAPDTGSYHNRDDQFDDKQVTPPPYGEKFTISASSLGKERPLGRTEYEDPGFIREANERAAYMTGKLMRKLRRGMELQASQVLTLVDGINLVNSANVSVYTLDYAAKSTHFPNAGTAWSSATFAQMITDLQSLADVIRNDGLSDPRRIIMGTQSFELFAAAAEASTAKRFDNRRSDRGELFPLTNPGTGGGQYRGTIDLGNFKLDIWTYGARYTHQYSGTKTLYVPNDKVIMLSDNMGFETVFGRVFLFDNGLPRPLPQLRARARMVEQGMDIFYNNWTELNGSGVTVELLSRPLCIPKGIDTFGTLDTGI
jgi:hypothetical protein